MSGYVYAIGGRVRGPIKIGLCSYPASRLNALQGGNPEVLRFYGLAQVSEPALVEQMMHRALAEWFIRGEWFDNRSGMVLETFDRLHGGVCHLTSAPRSAAEFRSEPRTVFDGWLRANYRTQAEFAAQHGLSRQRIGRWAKGVALPGKAARWQIASISRGAVPVNCWRLVDVPRHHGSGQPVRG